MPKILSIATALVPTGGFGPLLRFIKRNVASINFPHYTYTCHLDIYSDWEDFLLSLLVVTTFYLPYMFLL